jgi:hypothetical protein
MNQRSLHSSFLLSRCAEFSECLPYTLRFRSEESEEQGIPASKKRSDKGLVCAWKYRDVTSLREERVRP